MNHYEQLQEIASHDDVEVIDYPFHSEHIKGLYCDGIIGINNHIETNIEKSCVLTEELGHHYTTTGNIINQDITENRKQEARARLWAYNKKIGLIGIIKAYKHRCQSRHEIAEYLGVTEPFLLDALEAYRRKYGSHVVLDNYTIYFEPTLAVLESR